MLVLSLPQEHQDHNHIGLSRRFVDLSSIQHCQTAKLKPSPQVAGIVAIASGAAVGGKALFDVLHSLESIKTSMAESKETQKELRSDVKVSSRWGKDGIEAHFFWN